MQLNTLVHRVSLQKWALNKLDLTQNRKDRFKDHFQVEFKKLWNQRIISQECRIFNKRIIQCMTKRWTQWVSWVDKMLSIKHLTIQLLISNQRILCSIKGLILNKTSNYNLLMEVLITNHLRKCKVEILSNSKSITHNLNTQNLWRPVEVFNLSLKVDNRPNNKVKWIFKNKYSNCKNNNKLISHHLRICKWRTNYKELQATLLEQTDKLTIKFNMKTWKRSFSMNIRRYKRKAPPTNQTSSLIKKSLSKLWKIQLVLLGNLIKAWNLTMYQTHKIRKETVTIWTIQQHQLI